MKVDEGISMGGGRNCKGSRRDEVLNTAKAAALGERPDCKA